MTQHREWQKLTPTFGKSTFAKIYFLPKFTFAKIYFARGGHRMVSWSSRVDLVINGNCSWIAKQVVL